LITFTESTLIRNTYPQGNELLQYKCSENTELMWFSLT